MGPDEFAEVKREIMSRYPHARGGDVWGIETESSYYLEQWLHPETVKTKKTGEPTQMLDVVCQLPESAVPKHVLIEQLRRCYLEELCYQYFEAHTLTIAEETIALEFITLRDTVGPYVTGKIILDFRPRKRKKRRTERMA